MDYAVTAELEPPVAVSELDALQQEGIAAVLDRHLAMVEGVAEGIDVLDYRIEVHPRGASVVLAVDAPSLSSAEQAAAAVLDELIGESDVLTGWTVAHSEVRITEDDFNRRLAEADDELEAAVEEALDGAAEEVEETTLDAEHWRDLTEEEQRSVALLCAQFIAGEEAVTQDLQPFMAAMAAEGRFGDEMYLTQFCFEEAKHTQVFRLWMDAVGLTSDLHEFVEDNPGYRAIFYEALPESLNALHHDPSPENQVRASVTYNHVVEGTLALTGYYAWHKICRSRNILPGMQEVVRRIGDDERRHMAWGTFTCRRHVAADERN